MIKCIFEAMLTEIQRSYGNIISTAIAYLCIIKGSAGDSVVLDSRGFGFQPHRSSALCLWAKHFILCLVLFQPRKNRTDITEFFNWVVKNQIKQKTNYALFKSNTFWTTLTASTFALHLLSILLPIKPINQMASRLFGFSRLVLIRPCWLVNSSHSGILGYSRDHDRLVPLVDKAPLPLRI